MNDSVELPRSDCPYCQGSGTKMVVPLFDLSNGPLKHVPCDCQKWLEELRRNEKINAFKQGEEL